MMLFSVMSVYAQSSSTINSQSLEGKWKIGEGFRTLLQSALSEDEEMKDVQMDYILDFGRNNAVTIRIPMQTTEEDMDMTMEINFPGTYKINGNALSLKLDKKNVNIGITDVKTNDPEMKKILENPEARAALLSMMNSMIKEEMKTQMDEIGLMVDDFTSMSVQSVTDTQLELKFGEKDIKVAVTFERLDK